MDYATRRAALGDLQAQASSSEPQSSIAADLTMNMADGRIKLYLTWKTLTFRNDNQDLFATGQYVELPVEGTYAQHVIAFARQDYQNAAVVVVPRLGAKLTGMDGRFPIDPSTWKDTSIPLSSVSKSKAFTNVFTGEQIYRDGDSLSVLALFSELPGSSVIHKA